MAEDWRSLLRTYRLRHGLTQMALAELVGVSQRTISRWERGEDRPTKSKQLQLRDLGLEPPAQLLSNLVVSVAHCPVPRALSKMPRLQLLALSGPAIAKRPSIVRFIGHDLIGIATGILVEMLDDSVLQNGIANREIASVVCTTESVLRTAESPTIGKYQTTISYFWHDGTLFSDAISVRTRDDAPCGYRAVSV